MDQEAFAVATACVSCCFPADTQPHWAECVPSDELNSAETQLAGTNFLTHLTHHNALEVPNPVVIFLFSAQAAVPGCTAGQHVALLEACLSGSRILLYLESSWSSMEVQLKTQEWVRTVSHGPCLFIQVAQVSSSSGNPGHPHLQGPVCRDFRRLLLKKR